MLAQVAVGRRDHAHVYAARPIGSQALDLAVLQRAEQLGLDGQRQLPHLVKEQRATVGGLEAPRALARRTREGAAHMAEQFAFGQGFRQCGAVHVNQRAVPAA